MSQNFWIFVLAFIVGWCLSGCGEAPELTIVGASAEETAAILEAYEIHADTYGAVSVNVRVDPSMGADGPRGTTKGQFVRVRAGLSAPVLRYVLVHELCHVWLFIETGDVDAYHADAIWADCKALQEQASGL